jgi:hypothetical protein
MRPFRSRMWTALVMTVLCLGMLGTVASADDTPTASAPADPSPGVLNATPSTSFPEDPWRLPTVGFPEDPWPDP